VMRNAIAAAGVVLVLVATASSAFAYPSGATLGPVRIDTVYGPCFMTLRAQASPSLQVAGQVSATESVDCSPLTIAPFTIWLAPTIGGLVTEQNLNGPAQATRLCNLQDSCSWTHTRSRLPAGDYDVWHYVEIDLAQGSTQQQQYVGTPPAGCRVGADRGVLVCEIHQDVTLGPLAS
jgi:hypothetical protein